MEEQICVGKRKDSAADHLPAQKRDDQPEDSNDEEEDEEESDDSVSVDPKTYEELLDSDSQIWFWSGNDHNHAMRKQLDLEFKQQPLDNITLAGDMNGKNDLTDHIAVVYITAFFSDDVSFCFYVKGIKNVALLTGTTFSGQPYKGAYFATPVILHYADEILHKKGAYKFEKVSRGETKGLRFKYYYETCMHAWDRLRYNPAKDRALHAKLEQIDGESPGPPLTKDKAKPSTADPLPAVERHNVERTEEKHAMQ